MSFVKASTAPVITVGPVLDTTGAPYTTAPATTDFQLHKAGTWAAMSTSAAIEHSYQGQFSVTLAATDTDTVGMLDVCLAKADVACNPVRLMVLTANVYDSLVTGSGTDYLQVDTRQVEDTDATDFFGSTVPTVAGMLSGGVMGKTDAPTNFADLSITETTGLVALASTQKVDVDTIKTQTITCSAGVTVNPNVGTTQPVNFSGTGATAYVKGDVIQIETIDASDMLSTGTPTASAIATAVLAAGAAYESSVQSAISGISAIPTDAASVADMISGGIMATSDAPTGFTNLTLTNIGTTTAATVAAAILATPAHLLVTDGDGRVDVSLIEGVDASDMLSTITPTATEIAATTAATEVETGITILQALQRIGASAAGVITDAGTATETFYAMGSTTTPRITATVDATGNRTAITYDS